MFCSKCGKQLGDKNHKFCPFCGTIVSAQGQTPGTDTTQTFPSYEKMKPDKLLYESKGGQSARTTALAILGILIMLLSIFMIILAASSDMQRQLLGGRFANPDRVFIFGLVTLVIGGITGDVVMAMECCWLKIYEHRIEAQKMSLGFNKNYIQVYEHQIESVQLQGYVINVISNGKKIMLICKEPSRAYELIMNMISGRSVQ